MSEDVTARGGSCCWNGRGRNEDVMWDRPVRTPTVCNYIFDSISIHSNGNINVCCVDVNGDYICGNVYTDRIADVWNGQAYRGIRNWMLNAEPDTWCRAVNRHCPYRNVAATPQFSQYGHHIKRVRLEPISYCNLRCPVCPVETGFKQVPHLIETRAQKILPLETMLDIVAQLPDLEEIEYFGYGEPLIHKDTLAFLREIRRSRPDVKIITNTNGTVLTPALIKAIATEGLFDRVVFSIDGATPESYKKYRIGGSFEKAYGKMKALIDACREAGTWRQYVTDSSGIVQVAWQYIIFEWNDSDEEIALAHKLAKKIGVPIEWTITSGYGASKRFVPGSALEKSLMVPPDSFIHLSSNADIDETLKARGLGAIFDYCEIEAECDLLKLPYSRFFSGYRAIIRSDTTSLTTPVGAQIKLNIKVTNNTRCRWDISRDDFLSIGVRLTGGDTNGYRELTGVKLPDQIAMAGGSQRLSIPIELPRAPGNYMLILDVVQNGVCWFGQRGSSPLELSIHVQ